MTGRAWALSAALAVLAGCPTPQRFPGTEVMGNFVFNAVPLANDCPYTDPADAIPDGGFSFQGTFSRDPGGAAWFTISGTTWDAGFDGQYVIASFTAPRRFVECESVMVQETLDVALLSPSQSDALADQCPSDALDGGVPAPNDAGIQAPTTTPSGFEARLACGTLTDQVIPDAGSNGGAGCVPCTWSYTAFGVRR